MAYLLTLFSGILTGLAMPGNLFSFLIWGSLIFYLKNMTFSEKTHQRFFHTLIFSFSMLATTLWWQIPVLSKNIPEVIGGYSAVLGYLAFFGMILLLTLPYFLIWLMSELYNRKWRKYNYVQLVLFYSFAFTAAEILKQYGDLAFTGGSLGYALYDHIGILQLASFGGYLFLSFIIVLVNSVVAFSKDKDTLKKLFICVSLVYAINFSFERFIPQNTEGEDFSLTAIQLNIPQEIKYQSGIWNQYALFSDLLSDSKNYPGDLVILPESAFIQDIKDTEISNMLKLNIKNVGKSVIMGYPTVTETDAYNTAYLYNENGEITDSYNKVKLTPFAEFLPYNVIFGKMSMFRLIRYYTPGKNYNIFNVKGVPVGTQICFETYFPEVSSELTANGAGFLLAITNDGWFNTNTGLKQHFTQAVFRAVENRRDFVQVSNTGITAHIDRYGRIAEKFDTGKNYADNFNVKLNTEKTVYNSTKTLFQIAVFIITLLLAVI